MRQREWITSTQKAGESRDSKGRAYRTQREGTPTFKETKKRDRIHKGKKMTEETGEELKVMGI